MSLQRCTTSPHHLSHKRNDVGYSKGLLSPTARLTHLNRSNRLLVQHATAMYHMGIDFGTSGARVTVIDGRQQLSKYKALEANALIMSKITTHNPALSYSLSSEYITASNQVATGRVTSSSAPPSESTVPVAVADKATTADHKQDYGSDAVTNWTATWERVLFELIAALPHSVVANTCSIAIDGTSATALLMDANSGKLLAPAKLYNEAQGPETVTAAKAIAPSAHTATASTSTLCKLITWHKQGIWQQAAATGAAPCLMHQADWLAYLLHGFAGVSDWNNALKLGYDPEAEIYPEWLTAQEYAHLLPSRVLAPSAPIAPVTAAVASRTGLPDSCIVCAGTTDSIAAFVAAGVSGIGQAVTSLGSTMAVKLLSDKRVDDAAYGVYSHRLGGSWLVGGASNTGGAVLKRYFTNQQLQQLSARIDPSHPTGLDYYPLTQAGERFPVNDPYLQPRLEPRPADDAIYLQGMLEGMSQIEAQAYKLLEDLGASPVISVLTAGGGALNDKWTAMRAAALGVPVIAAKEGEASYGAALLARAGWHQHQAQQAGNPAQLLPLQCAKSEQQTEEDRLR